MIKEAINALVNGQDLSFDQTKAVFEQIFNHKAESSQIAAFLTALKIKGEKESEISAAATVVRSHANKINIGKDLIGQDINSQPIIDTCGTGGSGLNKFNISTAVSFVIASSGTIVAKHGNRAMSSSCGSADVLEALGINISAKAEVMEQALKKCGIAFLYAPLYHPALGEVAKIRREMGIRTIFNILGPLCNPAQANHQLLGVYSPDLVVPLAKVLRQLGSKRAMVVYGKDLKDEISLTGKTESAFLNNKKITKLTLSPASFGLKKIRVSDILADRPDISAQMIRDVLAGKKGASRDIVLANASACLYILAKVDNFKQGVAQAAQLIDQGKAKAKYLEFKNFLETNA
ncbi:MAG: anthranilate phosphoribosyltransferase [Candidatus Omnitrophica bacterium]|nr:anthranilate phosphoribosyltransferase [Candidatus Omnitrophota bacterium]